MNSTFDLKRFGKLIKAETFINKSSIVKLLLGLLLLLLIVYYLPPLLENGGIDNISKEDIKIRVPYLYSIFSMFVLLVPFFLYHNLYDKVKNIRYAMFPTSQLEKVISAIIQTSIITTALLMLVLSLFLLMVYLTTSINLEVSIFRIERFFEVFFMVIQVQSFLFLGIFWFKNNKILKMILILIAIIALLIWISYLITSPETVVYKFLERHSDSYILNFFNNHSKTISAILFPLLPWTAAFWKFKRTQI